MYRIYLYYFLLYFVLFKCKATDEITDNTTDYIEIKSIPSVLHNDNVYIPVLYQCSSLTKRLITLSIYVEHVFHRKNVAIFRRHWYCQNTSNIQILNVHVKLHRSIAYASDSQSNLRSWPIETGQLKIIMFENEEQNANYIIKRIQYTVGFLSVYERPKMYSIRQNPLIYKTNDEFCSKESEMIRMVNYPLVLTGGIYGKHVTFLSFSDYNLRWEKQLSVTRPKFSIVFWIYINEYCIQESSIGLCAILQHLTFDKKHLSPELFIDRQGHFIVHMFKYVSDLQGDHAGTIASIPMKDWCRIVFVVNQNTWNVCINCLKTWEDSITAAYTSSNSFYYTDELGTFIIGGNDEIPSFRGFIAQMDIYRRIALKPEQLPKNLHLSIPSILPMIISESNQCLHYFSMFNQCREQVDLFNQYIQQKNTCKAFSFQSIKSNSQCLLIRSWKQQSKNIRYRIYRALYQKSINSTNDVANKLFQLIINLLEREDSKLFCKYILTWSEQAVCYNHPAIHSLLATFYKFGLCGLIPNATRVVELLFNGAFLKDRMSLLALGHRHFYGLDNVPQDYDAAYVYYREMGDISKLEFYNPKSDEVVMEFIRLTNNELIDTLTFDQSDSFYWLQEQARRGVIAAQQRLGSLMYTGGNGLTRNMPVAVQYFHLAANQNDPASLFMYGLVLLKGQGITQNITEGLSYLEKAIKYGHHEAHILLGEYAYNIEKNYTKAAKYWQDCYDRSHNIFCAYNLGMMWAEGHYPPDFRKDYGIAWSYFSYAAQRGQADSRIMIAYYSALGGHPLMQRDAQSSAIWSRMVADESSAVGSIVRRALKAYQDNRWQTSLIFYLQAALAGIEIGYFNAGYLCYELKVIDNDETSIDCIKELLEMSLMKRDKNLQNENYDLLTIAEYNQLRENNLNKSIELYLLLFQSGDPRGLFNLAQMEENNNNISLNIWNKIGIKFEKEIINDKYRRLQTIYQHCRLLTIPRHDESYIPCTLSYFKISTIIFINMLTTTIISIVSIGLGFLL